MESKSVTPCIFAAKKGDLALLKELVKQDYPLHPEILQTAAPEIREFYYSVKLSEWRRSSY